MKFSTIFTILPVLALAAPALGSPVAKKRACTRPSASAGVSVSVSVSATASPVDSASASASASSAVESASASASGSESGSVEPTSSINTGVFAPEPTGSSASLEPTSSVAASSASEEPASSTSSADPAASSAASGDSDADLFVRLHNDFRAQYGAPAVEWDEELAQYAKDYAPICKLAHSNGPYGENLAGGAGDGYDISRAFQSWADEGNYYDWNKPGVLEATVDGKQMGLGHFTQVVWKSTTKIGCAAVSCADGTLFTGYGESLYVVCEYEAAGNVYLSSGDANALFVENVGTKI